MDRLLVKVSVPAVGLETDATIPQEVSVGQLTSLLSEAVASTSRGFYMPSGEEVICVERMGLPLDAAMQISAYQLENGDRLVLI